MRHAARRPSALRVVAGLVLLLTARAASAELVVTTLVPGRHTTVGATTIVAVTFDRAVNTAQCHRTTNLWLADMNRFNILLMRCISDFRTCLSITVSNSGVAST